MGAFFHPQTRHKADAFPGKKETCCNFNLSRVPAEARIDLVRTVPSLAGAGEATIHFTMIVGDKMTRRDLCEVCGAEYADPANVRKAIDLRTFTAGGPDQMISQLMAASSNYAMDAYHFVRAGLDRAQKKRSRNYQTVIAHISGTELLEALRELAIERFGKQAKATLNGWGIFKCEDFGEIVFNMIEAGLLAKQEKDTKADFQGGYDFDAAFPS